ncbi:MAG: hypothetical protein J6S23_02055 [Clostridia bacterium]|nr:hypothetical protein [Clostridia bacterium]
MEKSDTKKLKFSFAWKALTLVILLLIIYTGYHVFFGLAESVKTTPAGLASQSNSVILEGVIFREEELVSTKNQGDIRPYFSNGERVSIDSAVAAVYTKSGNAEANEKIAELEEKLEIMKRSNVKGLVSIVDIERVNSEIEKLYTSLMLSLSQGDNLKAQNIQKELLICLNQLKIYEGEVDNYNEEIKAIEAELDELYNSFEGEKEYIWADNGGYVYYNCDGYEQTLTLDALESLTVNGLSDILKQVKDKPVSDTNYRCKFVYSNVWQMATLCDNSTVALLEVGKEYSVTIFDIKERHITVTLEKIGESNGEKTLLVFSCSTMPEGFDYTRYQSFKLDISTIEGYRVPLEALQRVVDDETGEEKIGVYILNASVVQFRRVEIIAEGNGYYIVAKLDKSKENYHEYLDLNDLIILDTDGMYDGKTLKR